MSAAEGRAMRLSTETKSLRLRVGDHKAVEIIAGAGFDAIDYTFDAMCDAEHILNGERRHAYIADLRARAEAAGLCVNQAHAPFLFDWEDPAAYERVILPAVIRSIELAAALGAPLIVVHPIHHMVYAANREREWALNRDYFRALLPHARKHRIRLALENMLQEDPRRGCVVADVFADPRELLDFLEMMGDEMLSVCVDVGHAGPTGGDPAAYLRAVGERVGALHIHDNDYRADQHLPPFLGLIDWDGVCAALREIGYAGDFTFEASAYYRRFDEALLPAAARFLAEIGRHLMGKIQRAEPR